MRIIGLDPGLRRTGWGVIESVGNRLMHVADGVITKTAEGFASVLRPGYRPISTMPDCVPQFWEMLAHR